jgi:hypothetical protein
VVDDCGEVVGVVPDVVDDCGEVVGVVPENKNKNLYDHEIILMVNWKFSFH